MGSTNYQIAVEHGMVEGSPRYTNSVPHHAGEAYVYVQMYSASRERLLSLILDGEYVTEDGTEHSTGPLTAKIALEERFPVLAGSVEADYATAESNGTLRTYLSREDGSVNDLVPLTGVGYEITSDGWDVVERRDEWIATYYTAEVSRS